MSTPRRNAAGAPFVSTGQLPSADQVKALVDEAHAQFQGNRDGQNAQVYPALDRWLQAKRVERVGQGKYQKR